MKNKNIFILLSTGLAVVSSLCLLTTPNSFELLYATGSQPVPTSVSVATNPKTTYIPGETFDPTGLAVDVSCDNNAKFTIEYNEETASKFSFDQTVLSLETTKITGTYLGNTNKEFTIPVTVDNWFMDDVRIFENDEGRIIFSTTGRCSEEFKDNFEDAYIYFTPYGDYFKYLPTAAVVTDAEAGATYEFATDITDIPFSYKPSVDDATWNYDAYYWPHIVLETTEGGEQEDKDFHYTDLNKYTLHRTGDPERYAYVIELYTNKEGKSIPIIARTDTKDLSGFNHLHNADLTTVEDDLCYTVRGGDIELVGDRVLMSVTCAYKGDLTREELIRGYSYYLLHYNGSATATVIKKNVNSNYSLTLEFDVDFENHTFTFYIDITNQPVCSSKTYYYSRMVNDKGNENYDCKTGAGNKVNDGKSVTYNGNTYILYNNHGTDKLSGYGTLTCRIIKATA